MSTRSYSHATSPVALLGETLGENLRRTVHAHGPCDALVVRSQGIRLTWNEFHEQVRLCARGLMARGVKKGDRVGISAARRSLTTSTLRAGSAIRICPPASRCQRSRARGRRRIRSRRLRMY